MLEKKDLFSWYPRRKIAFLLWKKENFSKDFLISIISAVAVNIKNQPIEAVIGLSNISLEDYKPGQVELRSLEWKEVTKDKVNIANKFLKRDCLLERKPYYIPYDYATNFNDCLLWVVITTEKEVPIAPVKDLLFFNPVEDSPVTLSILLNEKLYSQ